MRRTFLHTLLEAAEEDETIVLVCGDLGFSVLEPFEARFPSRYFNVGINEQAAIGICTGLARQGFRVFYYSIINFATLRCLEQIRNDAYYHRADVTIVGVGAGFVYGSAGYTHWAVEDFGALAVLDGLSIFSPYDPSSTRASVSEILRLGGPAYLRLGKGGEPDLNVSNVRPQTLWAGADPLSRLVITHGAISGVCLSAAQTCAFAGSVIAVIDQTNALDSLAPALASAQEVLVVEEVVHAGGLGSRIEQTLLETYPGTAYRWRGVRNARDHHLAGSVDDLRSHHGLDVASIAELMRSPIR